MLKALVVKELRESAGIVVLGVIAAVYALGDLTATPIVPWQNNRLWHYPFVADDLSFYLGLVAGGLAIALGLRQTAWELGQGTYFFLLHRPIDRGRVFGVKLLIGGSMLMVFSAAMILIYSVWAAMPGHTGAPFFWSMTVPAWMRWVGLLPVYVGAFLSGIRPARWFGTRLIPLLAGIGATAVADMMPWFWAAVAISVVATAFGLISIFYYVQARDF
jgi:hypothetical protein